MLQDSVPPVAVDLPDRDVLEFFPSEDSARPSLIAPIPPALAEPAPENLPAGAMAAPSRQAPRRFRATLTTAGITLLVFALVGLVGIVVGFVFSRPIIQQPQVQLLDSAETAAGGSVISLPAAPQSIIGRALVHPAPPSDSTDEQVASALTTHAVKSAPATPVAVELPLRAVRVAPEASPKVPVRPPADAPRGEETAAMPPPAALPAPASGPPLTLPAAAVAPRLPLTELPPSERSTAVPAAASSPVISSDRFLIQDLLNRYQGAFNSLNASEAKAVWPSVDERSLDRAFDQLERQEVVFEACQTSITGFVAVASCQGHASYVPKIGNRTKRNETARWTFRMTKSESGWQIDRIESR